MSATPAEAASRPLGHIPTLDGWRGIAILMVLFDHITYAVARRYPHAWMRTGVHGVTLFFVLSGFLITSNLLSQERSLKKFYIRRFFRLMPVAWLFLATMLILGWVTGNGLTSWTEIRGCLLFYRNYQGFAPGGGFSFASHFWSLSIEEQFYLVWPSLLFLFGVRRCRWIAGLGAIAVAGYRYFFWVRYQDPHLRMHTEVHADALLAGCLLALLLFDAPVRERAIRLSRWLALPSALIFLFAIGSHAYCHTQPLWECAVIATLIAYTSLHPKAFLGKILDWKPLAWIGTVSYSLYIWQEVFIWFPRGVDLAVALCFGLPYVAVGSYYLVERPLRRLGRRLTGEALGQPAYLDPEIAPERA